MKKEVKKEVRRTEAPMVATCSGEAVNLIDMIVVRASLDELIGIADELLKRAMEHASEVAYGVEYEEFLKRSDVVRDKYHQFRALANLRRDLGGK